MRKLDHQKLVPEKRKGKNRRSKEVFVLYFGALGIWDVDLLLSKGRITGSQLQFLHINGVILYFILF